MPLKAEAMKTNSMQSYLEKDLVERLGIQNEVFESGSFTFRSEDHDEMAQATTLMSTSSKNKAAEDDDTRRKEMERGQVNKINPDSDSFVLNSDAEQSQSSFAAAQEDNPAGGGVQDIRNDELKERA